MLYIKSWQIKYIWHMQSLNISQLNVCLSCCMNVSGIWVIMDRVRDKESSCVFLNGALPVNLLNLTVS